MADGNGANGQRVTVALLGQKVDALADTMDDFIAESRAYRIARDDEMRRLAVDQARADEKIGNAQKDIINLETKSNRIDAAIASLTVVGSAISTFFGLRQ